ncbi:MAG: GTPase [Gemmatimonadetes bacterium]|nr:GTPase [Gemmatimonadota bacterium]
MDDTGLTRVLIMGAGGRDFHVFNTRYRHDHTSRVVAFTAAQIPHIENRRYPPVLSGALYPEGIPIRPDEDLEQIIAEQGVGEAIFAYSDVSPGEFTRVRERVEAAGARFFPFDPTATQIPVAVPCLAVCAVRTGSGKSGVARHLARALREDGRRVGVIRHPMPYGHLERQVLQRFRTIDDLAKHECTIEEMEEYEPHLRAGSSLFAGADYAKILGAAEDEADVILWDGGNNDNPFYVPDVLVTLLDPLRAGDELAYFPSRWNLENAHVLVIAKTDQATEDQIQAVQASAEGYNPDAVVVLGASPYTLDDPDAVRGKKVLVIEDGPTTTHGGMGYGAGLLAAKAAGAAEIVDPRPWAAGEIADAFEHYPHLEQVLPALGYGDQQLADLTETIRRVPADVVVVGTPIDLRRVITIDKPAVNATYGYADAGDVALSDTVLRLLVG